MVLEYALKQKGLLVGQDDESVLEQGGVNVRTDVQFAALAGALVGFLPYNFNPARTFMGDTGSNFLGYCLAIISILGIAERKDGKKKSNKQVIEYARSQVRC